MTVELLHGPGIVFPQTQGVGTIPNGLPQAVSHLAGSIDSDHLKTPNDSQQKSNLMNEIPDQFWRYGAPEEIFGLDALPFDLKLKRVTPNDARKSPAAYLMTPFLRPWPESMLSYAQKQGLSEPVIGGVVSAPVPEGMSVVRSILDRELRQLGYSGYGPIHFTLLRKEIEIADMNFSQKVRLRVKVLSDLGKVFPHQVAEFKSELLLLESAIAMSIRPIDNPYRGSSELKDSVEDYGGPSEDYDEGQYVITGTRVAGYIFPQHVQDEIDHGYRSHRYPCRLLKYSGQ